ncbi:MAG: glycosyltransferase family 9 protein [Acaryochloridaceae cyanobacterium SU_2_1]|nr:glycosyltransferase family 9 protein [Acaryochloridaceae cyanobacterium SU_2_1]
MTRVLAVIPGDIGRQLLFSSTLASLKQHYPQADIDVVVEPRAKSAYRVIQTVGNLIVFNFESRNGSADWGNLIGQMRDRRYDVGLTISRDWTAGLILWLVGIPRRIGYANLNIPTFVRYARKSFPKLAGTVADLSGSFLTNSIAPNARQYDAYRYHDLLQGIGITDQCPELDITIPTADHDWAAAEGQRLGINTNRPYVILHGGTGAENSDDEPSQLYPIKSWQSVVQGYQERQPEIPLLIVQGNDNQEWVASLVAVCPQLQVVTPQDVGQLAALIDAAHLMICADRAPLHLGVACHTRLVALFGALEPSRHLPNQPYFSGLKSLTNQVGDISPIQVLEKIWEVS